MRRFLWGWLPVLAWAGLIFLFSSQSDLPHAPERWLNTLAKKGSHLLEYAILAWLLLRAWRATGNRATRLYLYSLGMALLYALSDEYHQSFIPHRSPSPLDVSIDALGASSALVAAWIASGGPRWQGRAS